MKNREKYAKEIIDIALSGECIAVNKENKPVKCCGIKCKDCLLFEGERCCDPMLGEWAEQEYIEPSIDWTKVAVDTPILVGDDGKEWYKRYFAEFRYGRVYTWDNGATSWSVTSDSDIVDWPYAKLPE